MALNVGAYLRLLAALKVWPELSMTLRIYLRKYLSAKLGSHPAPSNQFFLALLSHFSAKCRV